MYEYIQGNVNELTPTYVIIDKEGIGFHVNISLYSYSKISESIEKNKIQPCKLFLHEIIREDAYLLFGFWDKNEREIFRLLISVSGVGANTARMILSSLPPEELCTAISNSNVNLLKSIKGIGAKSAQRIIVDLKDKISVTDKNYEDFSCIQDNTIKEESLSALVMLGFTKNASEKVITKILSEEKEIKIEELVKRALKEL